MQCEASPAHFVLGSQTHASVLDNARVYGKVYPNPVDHTPSIISSTFTKKNPTTKSVAVSGLSSRNFRIKIPQHPNLRFVLGTGTIGVSVVEGMDTRYTKLEVVKQDWQPSAGDIVNEGFENIYHNIIKSY